MHVDRLARLPPDAQAHTQNEARVKVLVQQVESIRARGKDLEPPLPCTRQALQYNLPATVPVTVTDDKMRLVKLLEHQVGGVGGTQAHAHAHGWCCREDSGVPRVGHWTPTALRHM